MALCVTNTAQIYSTDLFIYLERNGTDLGFLFFLIMVFTIVLTLILANYGIIGASNEK